MQLKIEQEVSNLAASSQQVSAVDLITNKRTITTKVMVEDGGILVLGGLISTRSREQAAGAVPRPIPLSASCSRRAASSKDKTNLMVFIRPRILRDGVDAAIETNAKYNYIREQQLGYKNGKVPLMPGERQPTLPALETLVPPELLNPATHAVAPDATPAERKQASDASAAPTTAGRTADGTAGAVKTAPRRDAPTGTPSARPEPRVREGTPP